SLPLARRRPLRRPSTTPAPTSTPVAPAPTEEVVATARRHAAEQGGGGYVESGDVYALGYDDASFDVVHAHQVLQHLSNPVAALKEMRRVTRPGGIVAVRDGDYSCFSWAPLDPRLDRWQELYRAVARKNGESQMQGDFSNAGRSRQDSATCGFPVPPGRSPTASRVGGGEHCG